jgi:GMP synthase-like glutamine amidotransferase
VILGSTCAVYDDEVHTAWFSKELDLIRDADHRGLGVFGICFGAQALCVAFGGTVAPSHAPEIGWYDVTSVGESPLPTGPFFEFHYDACAVPAHFEVLSRTDSAVQAFRVGRHFGTQYHPEIDAAQLTEWFRGGGDDAVRDFGHDLDELLERTRREETGARERARTLVQYFLAR